MCGHQWLEESWEPFVPADLDDQFAAVLMTLSFLASMDIAEAFRAEMEQQDLAVMATDARRVFPDAVAQYAHLGRTIHKVLIENQAAETHQRRGAKIGRNELCPCGSGRKDKMCCGARKG